MFDLLIRNGRVLDPAAGLDASMDVGLKDGKVAAVERGLTADSAATVVDATGRLVVPGLIDLHTHVYWGGTSLGVDADAIARRSGTTTFVDAGSAGPGNMAGFRRHVIDPSRSRILAYLNISWAGIYGFGRNVMVGECRDIMLCDAREAVAVAREHRERIVGMKVRVGRIASGSSGIAPLDIAMEAADRLGVPLMAHLDYPPPSRSEVLSRLRKGDVLTHCFKPFPNDALNGRGEIREEILEARSRGIWFDIGHGMGSLDFDVARAMLKQGFLPDMISSDVHALCVDGPAYDLLVTMSKFLSLGMPLTDVIRAATSAPAAAIGAPDLGTLRPGAKGDVSVLELQEGRFDYVDSPGQRITGNLRLVSHGIAVDGAWWPLDGPPA
ncbi:MAG: amidohydrolase/deacetylase family metallohydrolase [Geminicoccaceae bacterium]